MTLIKNEPSRKHKSGIAVEIGGTASTTNIVPSKEEVPNSKLSTFFLCATGTTTGRDLGLAALDGFNERIGNQRGHLRPSSCPLRSHLTSSAASRLADGADDEA